MEEELYDVVVIGAGASGITVANYTSRAGLNVALIERGIYGGQLNNTADIENYTGFTTISGEKLAQAMEKQVRLQSGVSHIYGNVKGVTQDEETNIFSIELRKKTIKAKTVVIATGVKHKRLDVYGEEDFEGRGVSFCAVCDGGFFKNKHVAVIGGGNSAVEAGIYLSNIVGKVSLVYYKDKSHMRAEKYLLDKFTSLNNTAIIDKAQTYEFHGKSTLNAITYFDGHENGEAKVVYVDGAFIYVGVEPTTESFKSLGVLDSEGHVVTDSRMRTQIDGLYAVGDVRHDSIRQIVSATGDGAIASDSIVNYFQNV